MRTAGYLGGALGGAIAAAATAGKPSEFTPDLMTGHASPFAEPSETALGDTALLYGYCRGSITSGPGRVLLNGKVVVALGEQQFAAILYTEQAARNNPVPCARKRCRGVAPRAFPSLAAPATLQLPAISPSQPSWG